jgi:hypothetical protein
MVVAQLQISATNALARLRAHALAPTATELNRAVTGEKEPS